MHSRARRQPLLMLAFGLVASACSIAPVADPGIGESSLTSVVYAADGTVLAEWHAGEDRIPISYGQLPQHLADAVVAIEDKRFWTHRGIDVRAIARALRANVESGEITQGGSTITQQYLKNITLADELTVDRKVNEATLAMGLEQTLTKEEILERYLNTVYFGASAYGVGAAADTYFDKQVAELTLAESALLAGLIKAPSALNPLQNPEEALARRRVVLEQMIDLEWITEEVGRAADAEPLVLRDRANEDTNARFPYFVEALKQQLLDDERLGETPSERYNALFRGGLRIHTTIDPETQEAARNAVFSVLPAQGPAGALVAVDPISGYVRAMVGGRDFYDPNDPIAQFNLATQGRRQPGSSFKTFVLATALEAGVDLFDTFEGGSDISIVTPSGKWEVQNYNGLTYPDLTLMEATVFSVNVVYAQLIHELGPDRVAEAAARAGITSDLDELHALALGAQEVSVLDMASAYATFAAEGIHVEPTLFTDIRTADGEVLVENTPTVTQAFSQEIAERVTSALTEVVKRGTGQQARIGRPVAGKTGTAQNHHDAWFVGYTPELSASVWVGFPEALEPLEPPVTPYKITGGTWPAQIWSRFAVDALATVPYGQLAEAPEDGTTVSVEVDLSTGFLAGPLCPRQHVHRIEVPADQVPTVICPIHNPAGLVEVDAGEVPDVIGIDIVAAVERLEQRGYEVRVVWSDGGSLAAGTVFGQDPFGGYAAKEGSVVRVTVAGPEPGSVVPLVLGDPAVAAQADLEALGLAVEVIVEAESNPDDAERRSGLTWKQSPAAGTELGRTATIWVNP